MLKYTVYVLLILHCGLVINAGILMETSWQELADNLLIIFVLLAMLFQHQINRHYRFCAYALLSIELYIFIEQLCFSDKCINAVLISPVIPLTALFLLGKTQAWTFFMLEVFFILLHSFYLSPEHAIDLGNMSLFSGPDGPLYLSLLTTLACLVIAHVYVNLNLQLRNELHRFASIDYLTGIANRASIDSLLEKAKQQALEQNKPLALAIADIDYFKDLNDQHGHTTGDQCLSEIARILSIEADRLQPESIVGRYGGEEFIIILPNCESMQEAQSIAEKLRLSVSKTQNKLGISQSICLTMGLAFAAAGTSYDQMRSIFKQADEALYEGKNNGRDRLTAVSI